MYRGIGLKCRICNEIYCTMKHFLYSLLGTIAGLWLSVGIGFLLLVFIMIGAAASGSSGAPVDVKAHSILHINLSGTVVDRLQPVKLVDELYGNADEQIALNNLIDAIRYAKEDDNIEGIYLDCKGASAGMAQLQAIVNALAEFKESGKWIVAYSDNYTQGNYYLASAADSIFMNPIGMVDIHGLSATTLYFKDLLEKIGVEAQVVKVGTYKSAVEPFLLNDMSEANREQQSHYLSRIWAVLADGIAQSRKVTPEAVNSWADGFSFTQDADYYLKNNIIDKTLYKHEMESLLGTLTDEEDPRLVDFNDYYTAIAGKKKSKGDKTIAVLYAVGDITESGDGGIASERLVPEIMDLTENEDIDGLILRVNSGGGSAFASEQIWEALEQFKKRTNKPFYVSMGDVAASGGYYISCGADRIYAESLTLTGSIGIFGIIPSAQKLLNEKIGVNTATVATNKGDLPTFFKSMSSEQRAAMQSYVDRGYKLFVSRCAQGRKVPFDSIAAVAEGRVWDGKSALEHGLVDKLGGLDLAIADMAADLDATDDYKIEEYPSLSFKWWEEVLRMSKNDISARIVERELGPAAPYYSTIKNFMNMHPLQCRMDYVTIQ